jgi:hypothetical protein
MKWLVKYAIYTQFSYDMFDYSIITPLHINANRCSVHHAVGKTWNMKGSGYLNEKRTGGGGMCHSNNI